MEIVQFTIGAPKLRPSAGIHRRQHFSFELLARDMAGESSCHAADRALMLTVMISAYRVGDVSAL
jgi:hypothetical protein